MGNLIRNLESPRASATQALWPRLDTTLSHVSGAQEAQTSKSIWQLTVQNLATLFPSFLEDAVITLLFEIWHPKSLAHLTCPDQSFCNKSVGTVAFLSYIVDVHRLHDVFVVADRACCVSHWLVEDCSGNCG